MPNKNSSILSIITIVTLLLSGYLFYQGIKPELSKFPIELLPSPLSNITPSPKSDVLGEQSIHESTQSSEQSMFPQAKVTKVVDGDTIEVEIDGTKQKLRYIGIDTPETVDPRRGKQCYGQEASDENKRIMIGKTVMLDKDISETDKFGRLLRYVYLKLDDGSTLFVNDYLVRQGFAHAYTYPPDVKKSELFLAAEREARENNRGLWQKCPVQ